MVFVVVELEIQIGEFKYCDVPGLCLAFLINPTSNTGH